jgi:tetratricopeptide (TPR) repeat protein
MKMLKIADKNNMNREDLLYLRNNNFEFSHLKNLLLANYYENLNSNNQNIQLIIKNNYKNIIDSSFHSSEIFNNYAVASVKSKNLNNAEEIFESNLNNFGPSAITFYNLSQLYIINNNLELAELYYSKAKTLDNSIPNFNKSKPNFLLTSIKKSFILKNLFYYITHTDDSLPNFMNYLFIPYIILTFILIISFFISTFSSQYNSLTHCSSCNIPILPDSFVYQHSRNTFCPYCMNIIVNPQYTNLITHGQKYINRNTFLKSFLINFFLPGGGLIYAKSNLTGIILTFISLFLIIPLIFKDFLITYSYTDLLIIKNIYLFLPVFIIISNIIIFYFFKKRRL